MSNPYRGLPDYCYWNNAMSGVSPWQINPVTKFELITPEAKVSTMGSCFAQHIARHIASVGCNYFIAETAPSSMSPEDARRRNYGVFSARYGNVYTAKQALQLFKRAFGEFNPKESVWQKGDRYIDPFRAQIEPDGFESEGRLEEDRKHHLSCVKRLFLESKWIVFTLGLTEAWRSKLDGAVFSTAPGVAGGTFQADRHEFINFSVDEVREDVAQLIKSVTSVNPSVRFLLTVSPVPLIATFEKRHVWVSTTVSKATLVVAADEATRAFSNVFYFPSYEIITSPAAGNSYYHDDLRQVREQGVAHVMRIFSESFLGMDKGQDVKRTPGSLVKLKDDIICDEEILDEAR